MKGLNRLISCSLIIWWILFERIDAANILCITHYPALSHQSFFEPIWKELVGKGHNLTVITPLPMNISPSDNFTEIVVNTITEITEKRQPGKNSIKMQNDFVSILIFLRSFQEEVMNTLLSDLKVQDLLNSSSRFDVIIGESHNPIFYAFGYHFAAPVIAISSLGVLYEHHNFIGNPINPLISPDILYDVETLPNEHPFLTRLYYFLITAFQQISFYCYHLPRADKLARKYFGNEMPYLGDVAKNYSSLVLSNANFVTTSIRANVPNAVELELIHIRKQSQPLPKNLQKILDSAKSGAVYFSLGTHVQTSIFDQTKQEQIFQALEELPYTVLLKWDADILHQQPSNVNIMKKFPQQDVLAHPNIRVFVTQGGAQSVDEAIAYEIPMVGIPFLGDQPRIVTNLVGRGLAIRLDPRDISKDSLKNAIIEVSENITYKAQIKKYKMLLEDQPLKGVDKAVWWIEYIIRHKGAKHLRSPAAYMPWYQYWMLDVIIFLLIFSSSFFGVIFILLLHFISLSIMEKPKWIKKLFSV